MYVDQADHLARAPCPCGRIVHAERRVGHIRDPKAMAGACEGAGVVFHNASIVHTKNNRQDEVWSVNLGGTETVLAACQSARSRTA